MNDSNNVRPGERVLLQWLAVDVACRIGHKWLPEHIVQGICAPSHANQVFPARISTEHGWSCVQKNAICNVLGGRTNNRPLQPSNGRVISLANAPSNIANN